MYPEFKCLSRRKVMNVPPGAFAMFYFFLVDKVSTYSSLVGFRLACHDLNGKFRAQVIHHFYLFKSVNPGKAH